MLFAFAEFNNNNNKIFSMLEWQINKNKKGIHCLKLNFNFTFFWKWKISTLRINSNLSSMIQPNGLFLLKIQFFLNFGDNVHYRGSMKERLYCFSFWSINEQSISLHVCAITVSSLYWSSIIQHFFFCWPYRFKRSRATTINSKKKITTSKASIHPRSWFVCWLLG